MFLCRWLVYRSWLSYTQSHRPANTDLLFISVLLTTAISPADIIVLCRCNIRVAFNTDTIKRNSGFARFPEFDVTDERKRKRKRFTMEVAIVEIVFLYTRGLMSRTFTLALRFYDIQCIIESDRVFELFCKFWITMITKITTG